MAKLPHSGYAVKEQYSLYDANKKFNITIQEAHEDPTCLSGDVMKGKIKPHECPNFGNKCTPVRPLGAVKVHVQHTIISILQCLW
jgi:hydrogenase expression/formation protein HypD